MAEMLAAVAEVFDRRWFPVPAVSQRLDLELKPYAIARLTTAASTHPFDRDSLLLLATYLAEIGRLGAARTYAERVLAIDPTNPEARALAARVR